MNWLTTNNQQINWWCKWLFLTASKSCLSPQNRLWGNSHLRQIICCTRRLDTTYSTASACWTLTCCLVEWTERTWCSHHCDIWSSPLLWLCLVSERQNKSCWMKTRGKKRKTSEPYILGLTLCSNNSAYNEGCYLTIQWLETYVDLHFPVQPII